MVWDKEENVLKGPRYYWYLYLFDLIINYFVFILWTKLILNPVVDKTVFKNMIKKSTAQCL